MPVLGKQKRVLTVWLHEIDSDFYFSHEQFFMDEEGYDLEKSNIPSAILAEVEGLVDNHSHLDKATHICFVD
ncbi:hypothetical protein VPHD51_0209 [Vibrio phage D51]